MVMTWSQFDLHLTMRKVSAYLQAICTRSLYAHFMMLKTKGHLWAPPTKRHHRLQYQYIKFIWSPLRNLFRKFPRRTRTCPFSRYSHIPFIERRRALTRESSFGYIGQLCSRLNDVKSLRKGTLIKGALFWVHRKRNFGRRGEKRMVQPKVRKLLYTTLNKY